MIILIEWQLLLGASKHNFPQVTIILSWGWENVPQLIHFIPIFHVIHSRIYKTNQLKIFSLNISERRMGSVYKCFKLYPTNCNLITTNNTLIISNILFFLKKSRFFKTDSKSHVTWMHIDSLYVWTGAFNFEHDAVYFSNHIRLIRNANFDVAIAPMS